MGKLFFYWCSYWRNYIQEIIETIKDNFGEDFYDQKKIADIFINVFAFSVITDRKNHLKNGDFDILQDNLVGLSLEFKKIWIFLDKLDRKTFSGDVKFLQNLYSDTLELANYFEKINKILKR